MKRALIIVGTSCLVILASLGSPPIASAASFTGVIVSRSGVPVAGLTVQLIHPTVGRSVHVVTDTNGQFRFINVPASDEPYYLAVYWGEDLVHWQEVTVKGGAEDDVGLDEPIRLR